MVSIINRKVPFFFFFLFFFFVDCFAKQPPINQVLNRKSDFKLNNMNYAYQGKKLYGMRYDREIKLQVT